MTVLLKFLANLVDREDHTTAESRLVEKPDVLIDSKFPEGLFNEFFVRAAVIIPLAAAAVVDSRRRDRHCVGARSRC